jgi:hypothetical protein
MGALWGAVYPAVVPAQTGGKGRGRQTQLLQNHIYKNFNLKLRELVKS